MATQDLIEQRAKWGRLLGFARAARDESLDKLSQLDDRADLEVRQRYRTHAAEMSTIVLALYKDLEIVSTALIQELGPEEFAKLDATEG
ncbi:MAG: hypothetical protein J7513_02120 [Solirubrobacteraceae bacterium]|nr:hypothetical protein [Solirubrobacteraceae bacterium]